MMDVTESNLQGCFELQNNKFLDERGSFVKTFHTPTFESFGLCTDFKEEYYSVSHKGVIRGMHFQLPPNDHVKLVYCTSGMVLDVVLDIRKGSPTFGKCASFELSADKANMIYIPKGMAHGFCVLSEQATMLYKLSSIYSPDSDFGIRWDTIDFDWPVSAPLMSSRDQGLDSFADFDSAFTFGDNHG